MTDQARQIPFADLPELDPGWSRFISVIDASNTNHTFHYLDSFAERVDQPRLTIVCVHGNPTWSYLWRRLLALAPDDIRVIAVDQLGMGYSDRLSARRTLAQRVADLADFVQALDITTPIISIAHDWGGPISLGWVEKCITSGSQEIAGVVLLNTAVHQPEVFKGPGLIRLARARALLAPVTQYTPIFVRGTTILSGRKIPRSIAKAFALPYKTAADRYSVRGFVADIPFEPNHESRETLDDIAAGLSELNSVPVLLCWGPSDPVFSDQYLRDFIQRIPHAVVHRYVGASHLVSEDAPQLFPDVLSWIDEPSSVGHPDASSAKSHIDLNSMTRERAQNSPTGIALTVMGDSVPKLTVSWRTLDRRINEFAAGMRAAGIKPGDRIALMIPPGPELIALIYAAWSVGACIVLADSGLGVRGIARALKGAHPDHVFAIRRAWSIIQTLQIPGRKIYSDQLSEFRVKGAGPEPSLFDSDLQGAVVFTSGSTGPAKGVLYSRGRIAETVNTLRRHYQLGQQDVIVAAFAPWAVFGPALGVGSVLPQMDLSKPSSLGYAQLNSAIKYAGGTLLWASPAALRNVLRTAPNTVASRSGSGQDSDSSIRLILSAGAPVSKAMLAEVSRLFPSAELRTPYGMTEALPLTDISLDQLLASDEDMGVAVGAPLSGVDIQIAPWNAPISPSSLTSSPNVMGEIVVRAAHMRDTYDRLEFTQRKAAAHPGWHRTGDVGHLDDQGRLWVEGRLAHVISTMDGPVTPVPIEQRVERLSAIEQAACVGVGPVGNQVVVVVVVLADSAADPDDLELADAIRSIAGVPVSAVLTTRELPTDIRHNAKINREQIARWASATLGGRS